jgi:hypothetical protein
MDRSSGPKVVSSIGSFFLDPIAVSSIMTIARELEDSEAACKPTHGRETTCHLENTIKSYYPPSPDLSVANDEFSMVQRGQRVRGEGDILIAEHVDRMSHQPTSVPPLSKQDLDASIDKLTAPGGWPKTS